MWILQVTARRKTVTRTYHSFGQLALDDENFPITQDLADHDYMTWIDDEMPETTNKLGKALRKTGYLMRKLPDGSTYKLCLIVAARTTARDGKVLGALFGR